MYNGKTFTSVLILAILLTFIGCEKKIKPNDAPPAIKAFVGSHFPNCKIHKITREKENGVKSFDVNLDCNVNFEFEDGDQMELIDIDSHSKLPNAIIAQPILDYVSNHYPNSDIIGWEYEANKTKQHIELNTKELLEFDNSDKFIKIVEYN